MELTLPLWLSTQNQTSIAAETALRALRPCILWFACVFVSGNAHSNDALVDCIRNHQDATHLVQELINGRNGLVELPPGRILLNQSLQVDLQAHGYFALRASPATTLVMAAPGPALIIRGTHFKSADPDGFNERVWQSERMPVIESIAIEGAHPQADGIQAVGTMQLTIDKVHLRKLRHGIHLTDNNRNVLISNSHIYENTGVGIFYDDVNLHQSNVVGCHVSYCDMGGLVSRGGNVRNIHVSGCDFERNMSADQEPTANILIDCADSQYGTAEVAITGCTIQHNDAGPESANIRILGRTRTSQGDIHNEGHVTISGNVLSDVHTNVHLRHCRGVVLQGNTFWMGFEHNLLVEDCSHVVVGPNNFDRNPRYNYGNSLEAKNQLIFRDCRDSTLTGLHIAHVADSTPALSIIRCDRMHLDGLTILDCDVGVHVEDVTRSKFGSLLLHDSSRQEKRIHHAGTSNATNTFSDDWKTFP